MISSSTSSTPLVPSSPTGSPHTSVRVYSLPGAKPAQETSLEQAQLPPTNTVSFGGRVWTVIKSPITHIAGGSTALATGTVILFYPQVVPSTVSYITYGVGLVFGVSGVIRCCWQRKPVPLS